MFLVAATHRTLSMDDRCQIPVGKVGKPIDKDSGDPISQLKNNF